MGDELNRKGERCQLEGASDVTSALANTLQGQSFHFVVSRGVDLECTFSKGKDTEGFECIQIGFERGYAPELWCRADFTTHVEYESSRGRTNRSQFDDVQLPTEIECKDRAFEIDFEDDFGTHRHYRIIEQIAKTQFLSAGQFDKEALGLSDNSNLFISCYAPVSIRILPTALNKGDGKDPDIKLTSECVTEGVGSGQFIRLRRRTV